MLSPQRADVLAASHSSHPVSPMDRRPSQSSSGDQQGFKSPGTTGSSGHVQPPHHIVGSAQQYDLGEEDAYIPHVVLVLKTVFINLQKLVASEAATRRLVEQSFWENVRGIADHEVEARKLQYRVEEHAKMLAAQRVEFCLSEENRREVLCRRYDTVTAEYYKEFRDTFAALEYGMVAQYNHICSLRERYAEDLQRLLEERRTKKAGTPTAAGTCTAFPDDRQYEDVE